MDNRYFNYGCPALMQDGRFLTNHIRSRLFDQAIRNINSIDSAQDFKVFIQKNGDIILNNERTMLNKLNTCDVSGKCAPLGNNPIKFVNFDCGCEPLKLPVRHIENMCGCKSINN
jgi:hypothetical protein